MQPVITLRNGTLVTARPDSAAREIMTVLSSTTDGETWIKVQTVYYGPAAYSSLAHVSNGEVYLAFERNTESTSDCTGESCSIWWALVN